jgi:hypothetical protein
MTIIVTKKNIVHFLRAHSCTHIVKCGMCATQRPCMLLSSLMNEQTQRYETVNAPL